jgi:hypothetical protein
MPLQRKSYSDRQVAFALVVLQANRGNLYRTARQLGVPRNTLRHWACGGCHPDMVPETVEDQPTGKRVLAGLFEDLGYSGAWS